ncbi:MAG: ATP-binding protein [Candidatus Hydrothermales bacterium]
MNKINFKLTLVFFILILFFTLFITLFQLKIIREEYLKNTRGNLENFGVILSEEVKGYIISNDFEGLKSIIKKFGENFNLVISVYNSSGELIADSKLKDFLDQDKNKPEIEIALHGEKAFYLRKSENYKEKYIFLAIPIIKNENEIFVLRLGTPISTLNNFLINFILKVTFKGSFLLLIFLLLSLTLFKQFTDPLRDLIYAFKRVSQGDTNIRIFLKRSDELGELIKSFNDMVINLERSLNEVKRERATIDSLLRALPDNVFVLNKKGEVIYYNEKTRESFKNIEKCKFYYEFLKEPEFSKILEKALEKEEAEGQIMYESKFFYTKIRKIPNTENFIVVLTDITEVKRLEEIKKDLTVNISHEIRTPLTLIKGYIETIEDEEEIKNKNYIAVIKRHIDRLIELTEKIIYLSQIESEKFLQIEKVNLREIVENVLPIFEKKLREKEIIFKLEMEEGIGEIDADKSKLEQVFINLFDNSIKFTTKGEIKIKVQRKENLVRIEFLDTGEGIEEKHLPRVFERFYVGSKEKAGFGLGLSIVKHIINLHNGKVNIESQKGKGTRVIIDLPYFNKNLTEI